MNTILKFKSIFLCLTYLVNQICFSPDGEELPCVGVCLGKPKNLMLMIKMSLYLKNNISMILINLFTLYGLIFCLNGEIICISICFNGFIVSFGYLTQLNPMLDPSLL